MAASVLLCSLRRLIGRLLGYEQQIQELERNVDELRWDDSFGMWTRRAFLQLCHVTPRGKRTVAFIDLDDIHGQNEKFGYTEVNRKIREAFTIPLRSSDLVARWYSGDEIVILFDTDISGAGRKILELAASAERQGLGFSYELGTWDVGREGIVAVVDALSKRNARRRAQGE